MIPMTKDLLRSQPAFGQLPSQVASGRGTDGSSILVHPVSQRRPSPPTIHARRPSPTIVMNLLRGLFGRAAPDDARCFDNSTASHAMDLSLLASLQQNPATYNSYRHSLRENKGLTELVVDEAAGSLKRSATTTTSLKRSTTAESTTAPQKDNNAKDKVEFGMEVDAKGKTSKEKEPAHVAQYIKLDDGTKYDLQTLKSDQIRKLPLNFGCKGVQSATLFNCRKAMATRISMGVIYNNMNVANPSTTTDTIKINTCIRISNAFVHPEILPYTLTMNDKKDRADFEHGNGARNKNLYMMIADMVNDTERNDEIGVLLDGDGEEGDDDFDIHINKLFKEGNINPRHYTTVSWEYVRGFASDLVNTRKNMKKVSRKDELTQFSEWFLIVSFTP
jgi:hypothetical protein